MIIIMMQIKNTIGYYHVDLVCCHEFPDVEGEYVIEVCHSDSSYKVWPVDSAKLGWEWKFGDTKCCIWHSNATKMEVEYQRYYTQVPADGVLSTNIIIIIILLCIYHNNIIYIGAHRVLVMLSLLVTMLCICTMK